MKQSIFYEIYILIGYLKIYLINRSKFDPRHHNTVISEKQLETKKYKKEYKAAVKEIRKDNKFISKIQFKESMEK